MLYAFTAVSMDNQRVLLLQDAVSPKEATTLCVQSHPEKEDISLLSYVPVWAVDVYPVLERWKVLKGVLPFDVVAPYGNALVVQIPCMVSVARLLTRYSPWSSFAWWWGGAPSKVDVLNCLQNNQLASESDNSRVHDVQYHAERIAWLVKNYPSDPITVYRSGDAGIFVLDGNHRLCAADFMGLKQVLVRYVAWWL